MTPEEIQHMIDQAIKLHTHKGVLDQRVHYFDLFDNVQGQDATSATIATTGNTDVYAIATDTGTLVEIDFSGTDALAASNSNYITWTVTNLGQAGAGTAVLLAATDANTTKATGGTALAANTKRTFVLTTTPPALSVVKGDRLRIRAAVTGTLANTVTFPTYLIQLQLT